MIKTLTLNPAVDKAVTIERFAVDKVNRIATVRLDAGGKGINVARVLSRLGAPALAVAPVAGGAGRFLDNRLTDEGIPHAFVEVTGETRTNLKVVDPVMGTHTDINEPGPALTGADLGRLADLVFSGLGPDDWVVFSGSVPAGVPKDLYATWIEEARVRGARTVLDADGELFARGLEGKPDLVKPNRAELEAWAGQKLDTDEALLDAADRLRAAGVGTVAISLGSSGAWLVGEGGAWFAPGLKVDAKSTVGAGDAFLAALTWSFTEGLTPSECLAMAVATATASVVKPGTGAGDSADIDAFLARVAVRHHEHPLPISGRKQ